MSSKAGACFFPHTNTLEKDMVAGAGGGDNLARIAWNKHRIAETRRVLRMNSNICSRILGREQEIKLGNLQACKRNVHKNFIKTGGRTGGGKKKKAVDMSDMNKCMLAHVQEQSSVVNCILNRQKTFIHGAVEMIRKGDQEKARGMLGMAVSVAKEAEEGENTTCQSVSPDLG